MYGSCHPIQNHMWKLTDSVKCEICNQGVANVFYLRKHMREVHPDNNLQIKNE